MPNKAENSDDSHDDDDVADPDFSPETVGTNALNNNGLDEDGLLIPAHEEASAPTQQPQNPCAQKRRMRTENIIVV